MRVQFRLWLEDDAGNQLFGEGLRCLLHEIERTGSISGGAHAMRMSYRHAWEKIHKAEERLGFEIVHRQSGGASGGGSGITTLGWQLLRKFDLLYGEVYDKIADLSAQHLD